MERDERRRNLILDAESSGSDARNSSPTPFGARASPGARWSASIVEGKVSSRDFGLPPRRPSLDDISVRTSSPAARRSSQSSPSDVLPMTESGARGVLCTNEPTEEASPHMRPTNTARRAILASAASGDFGLHRLALSAASSRADSPTSSRASRRHSISSATIPMRCVGWAHEGLKQVMHRREYDAGYPPVHPCRYVEWTPADEPSRRRGRLIVQSERNVDFLQRLKARQIQASASKTEEDIAFAESLLSENFLFSQARLSARAARLIEHANAAG